MRSRRRRNTTARRRRNTIRRGLSQSICFSVVLGGAKNGEGEQRKGEGGFVNHGSEEWKISVNDNCKFSCFVLYLSPCTMQCAVPLRNETRSEEPKFEN